MTSAARTPTSRPELVFRGRAGIRAVAGVPPAPSAARPTARGGRALTLGDLSVSELRELDLIAFGARRTRDRLAERAARRRLLEDLRLFRESQRAFDECGCLPVDPSGNLPGIEDLPNPFDRPNPFDK